MAAGWGGVRVEVVDGESSVTDLGRERSVSVLVDLGPLTPDDVAVQLLHVAVTSTDELSAPKVVPMARVDEHESSRYRYTGSFACERAGRYGFTVRVVPSHPDLASIAELGRVTWA